MSVDVMILELLEIEDGSLVVEVFRRWVMVIMSEDKIFYGDLV